MNLGIQIVGEFAKGVYDPNYIWIRNGLTAWRTDHHEGTRERTNDCVRPNEKQQPNEHE